MDASITASFIGGSIMGYFCSRMAKKRGRSPVSWFFVGFFLGLFGVLALSFLSKEAKDAVLPPKKAPLLPSDYHDQLFYYLDTDKKPIGPMSYPALEEAFDNEKITPTSYIWNDSLPDWQKINTFEPSQ
ncbi:MAG: DUF4339 domain-containing protein [Simkaniaceae bacterium]|nr:DUF4339 domain-containing protein [Simkaniaceae bacterium]